MLLCLNVLDYPEAFEEELAPGVVESQTGGVGSREPLAGEARSDEYELDPKTL